MSQLRQELESAHEPIIVSSLSRREQRALSFHLLYVFDAFDYALSLEELCATFRDGFNIQLESTDPLAIGIHQVVQLRNSFDAALEPYLVSWRLERLSVSVRLIIRYAFWELGASDLEEKIIINEAIELAKCFAETDAYKFVNGVLDEAIKGGIRPSLKNIIG